MSVPAADTIAVLAFEGTEGQRVSISLTDVFGGSASVVLYDPFGKALQGVIGLSGLVEPTTLRSNATYSVVFDPQTASATSATLTMYNVPPDITGPIGFGPPSLPVTTMVPGQNARLTFTGTSGQRVSVTQAGFNCLTSVTTILRPDGTTQTSTCGGTFVEVQTLTATGTYTILVDPKDAGFGSTTLKIYEVTDLSLAIVPGGAAVPVTTTVPGQDARLTFAATAGQRVSLGQAGFNCLTSSTTILRPDGTTQASACGGDYIDVQTLTPDGQKAVARFKDIVSVLSATLRDLT